MSSQDNGSGRLDFQNLIQADSFPGLVLSTAEHDEDRIARISRESSEHTIKMWMDGATFVITWVIVLGFLFGSASVIFGFVPVPPQAMPFADRLFFVLIGGLAGAKMMARSKEK
jgi:hypothetical protein